MGSLADLSEIVGFFSYSRDDDEDSKGALSALRDRIQRELRGQLGRTRADFRLWQDTAAIAHGTLWEEELKSAVAQSVFFIPIVTPTGLRSRHCKFEFESFLKREGELGRADLVFPILYIRVPALEDEKQWRTDPVLSIVRNRQYLDWQEMRFRDVNSAEVGVKIERFCRNVFEALHAPYLTAEERRQRDMAAAALRADEERTRQQEAADRQRAEERRRADAEARRIADEEQRRRDEETRRRAEGLRQQVDTKRTADEEQRRKGAEARMRIEAELARRKAEGQRAGEGGFPRAPSREGQTGAEVGWKKIFSLMFVPWKPIETPQMARQLTAASAGYYGLVAIGALLVGAATNAMAPALVVAVFFGACAIGLICNSRAAAIVGFVFSWMIFYTLLPIAALAGVRATFATGLFKRSPR